MTARTELGFVQARIQARHGRRPDAATWRMLAASTDQTAYLHTLRTTYIGPWVQPLTALSNAHVIERTLRREWLAYVDRVARWSPRPWQPALACCATLPYLALIESLRQGRPPPDWARKDPVLGAVDTWQGSGIAGLSTAERLAPVAAQISEYVDAPDAWLRHWRALWPDRQRGEWRRLDELHRIVGGHLQALSDDASRSRAAALRARLEAQLTHKFRTRAQTVTAIFCHLGLIGLDILRVRGGLVRRCVFAANPAVR